MEHANPPENNWNKLKEDHEIAYLRGSLATSSSESYTLEEMRSISEGMDASTAEVEATMRKDFESMCPNEQAKMLDMLKQADPGNYDWWFETLVGKMPDKAPDGPIRS